MHDICGLKTIGCGVLRDDGWGHSSGGLGLLARKNIRVEMIALLDMLVWVVHIEALIFSCGRIVRVLLGHVKQI